MLHHLSEEQSFVAIFLTMAGIAMAAIAVLAYHEWRRSGDKSGFAALLSIPLAILLLAVWGVVQDVNRPDWVDRLISITSIGLLFGFMMARLAHVLRRVAETAGFRSCLRYLWEVVVVIYCGWLVNSFFIGPFAEGQGRLPYLAGIVLGLMLAPAILRWRYSPRDARRSWPSVTFHPNR